MRKNVPFFIQGAELQGVGGPSPSIKGDIAMDERVTKSLLLRPPRTAVLAGWRGERAKNRPFYLAESFLADSMQTEPDGEAKIPGWSGKTWQ